ncbi:MAG: carboxypeptidase regulatory-like domain-containing protein [Silvibacterium sp.]
MALALPAGAQLSITTAALSGTVEDSSGAVMPNAAITLTSGERGIVRTTTTNGAGRYTFSQLPPSTYTLSVQVTNFTKYEQRGIVLNASQAATQDVTLTPGSVNQHVVVNSDASMLNTDNANISTDINDKQIVELPLNLRNIYGLVTLNSSVNNNSESQNLLGGGGNSTDNADQDISFLHFSGGFFSTTGYLLDGVWNTDPSWGAVVYVPSVDAVQELKVQNNSFTAQYGWSTGNVVNVTTKSGTSNFHGDIWEFYRNSALDANLWFNDYNNDPKESVDRNQAGVAIGGPVYIPHVYEQRNKTFFFGVYEHLGLSTPLLGTYTVPDSQFRGGDFSQLLGSQVGVDALGRPIYSGQIYNPRSTRPITAGQVDPSTGLVATQTGYIRDPIPNNNVASLGAFDPLGAKLITYYPNPTTSGLSNNFSASASAPAESNEYSIRIDQNINDANRLYGRYSYKSEYKTNTPNFFGDDNVAGPGNIKTNNRYSIAFGYTHTFSPTLTMNLIAGYEYWNQGSTGQSPNFQPTTLGLPSYLDQNSPEFPVFNIGNQSQLGTNNYNGTIPPLTSAAADFMKSTGKHTISFGYMFVNTESNFTGFPGTTLDFQGTFTEGPNPQIPTPNTGNGLAQSLLGVLDGGQTSQYLNPAITKRYNGWYVQDDYRPLRNLTLNLGLRYEYQGAPTYRHNAASYFDPSLTSEISSSVGTTLPGSLVFLSSDNRGVYATRYTNVAPRVGFTYQPIPKVVMRGGYGIFYTPAVFFSTSAPGNVDGFSSTTSVLATVDGVTPNPAVTTSNPWPEGFVPITGNSLGGLQDIGENVTAAFHSRQSPYTQQYMLGFQYLLSNNDSIDVAYVGNHGTHMPFGSLNRTQVNPQYLSLGPNALDSLVPNPFYGKINAPQSSCGLNLATVQYAHLLQPYSQYCNVTENYPAAGFDIYNSLQATYNHRFNKGLSIIVSYTYSKFLDNTEGTQSWAYVGNSSPANNYNLAAEKSVDAGDTPHSLVANYIYDLPVGRGKRIGSGMNHKTDAVLGGWEWSGIATAKSGIPLAFNGNDIPSYGGNPRPDIIGDPNTISHRSVHEWFNTGAFAYAPYGTFGTAPRYDSTVRAPDYVDFDTAIMKNWSLGDVRRIQFRTELFNAFNHPQFYSPNTGYNGCDPNSGPCASSFGQISSTFPSREIQFAGKFYW